MRHHPGAVLVQPGSDLAQDAHPGFDITPLCAAHLPLGRCGQVRQIAILNPDEIRLVEGEVEVELDEAVQCCDGVTGAGHHSLAPGQQAGAHLDEQFDE